MQPAVVEPVDVLERRDLQILDAAPRSLGVNEFGLVQADRRLGEGVVVAVAVGADRRDGTRQGEPLGVADRQVQVLIRAVSVFATDCVPSVCGIRLRHAEQPGPTTTPTHIIALLRGPLRMKRTRPLAGTGAARRRRSARSALGERLMYDGVLDPPHVRAGADDVRRGRVPVRRQKRDAQRPRGGRVAPGDSRVELRVYLA